MNAPSAGKKTYPHYETLSGWNVLLPEREARRALPAQRRVRSVVIGAGYTGVAAARRLAELEPDSEVLLVDSAVMGESSAGRNSGFIARLPNRPLANRHGSADEAAHRQMAIYDAGLVWLRELIAQHGIDCNWDETSPKYNAAATADGAAGLKSGLGKFRDWKVDYEELDQDALEPRLGTRYYQYGYRSPYNVFVQPAALIRGLADSLPPNVHLLEDTPVVRVDQGRPLRVHTPNAVFEADRIIVANNAFAKSLGILRSRVIAIYTYAGLTPALSPEELGKLGADPCWGLIPAHRLGTTLRKIEGGRFMVRSAYSYERQLPISEVKNNLTALYRKRYPHLKSHDFEHVWGGTTALTLNGGVYFGQVKDGIYASVGCNGAGVLRGSIQGKLLAEMACGQQSKLLSDQLSLEGPNWIPPEPFRSMGVLSVIAMERRKAGLER